MVYYVKREYNSHLARFLTQYFTKCYCDVTATELIVPSKKTYNLFKEKYKVNRNVHIVPTGIDVERFYKMALEYMNKGKC